MALLLALLVGMLLPVIAQARGGMDCPGIDAALHEAASGLSLTLPGDGAPDAGQHQASPAKKPRLTQLCVVSNDDTGCLAQPLHRLFATAAITARPHVPAMPSRHVVRAGKLDPVLELHPGQAPPASA